MRLPIRAFFVAIALTAAAHGAGALAAGPQEVARIEHDARWAVLITLLDGLIDRAALRDVGSYRHVDDSGREGIAVCGTVEFADPYAGLIHFTAFYTRDDQGWAELAGEPSFHWPDMARERNSLAAFCDAAEERVRRGEEARLARTETP